MQTAFLPRSFFLLTITCFLSVSFAASGQAGSYRQMVRVYEDNDIIKLLGAPSDKGYTNGTRLDYYYVRDSLRSFPGRWMPKAGPNAIHTVGLSLMQIMYTPEDIRTTEPDVTDWPYTGALFAVYSLHSANPVKKYSLRTEVVGGVMGKASLAEQLQTFVHRHIGSPRPMGWDKQYPADVLLNLNLGLEKMLWQYRSWLDVVGGGQLMAGTMMNGADLYGQVRVGLMQPYFSGLTGRYARPFGQKRGLQCYFILRPQLEWVVYDAVLDGGVFSGRSDYYAGNPQTARINHGISRQLDLGIVLGYGFASLSFTQRIMPRTIDGFPHQRLGNLSLHIAW